MTKLILMSHGGLAGALLESASMIAGPQKGVVTLGLYENKSVDTLKMELEDCLCGETDVLVLTDLFFGSPFNVALELMQKYDFQHITGMNMAIVIMALMNKDEKSAEELCREIVESTKESILYVNEYVQSL